MKRKMISMLLALTLVVTGVPSGMTVNAAEVAEGTAMISTDTEESGEVVESADLQMSELGSEADGLYTFNVSESGKAIGSDGVVYDDVVYLSADTVNALNDDAQNAYFAFCDDIASVRNEGGDLSDVVVAVDENGTLAFHYAIPVKAVAAAMDELAEDFMEHVDDTPETNAEDTENDVQTVADDNAQTEEETTEQETQTVTEESSMEEASTTETDSEEENSVEETTTEDVSMEESDSEASVSTEESAVVDTASEETDEPLTEETSVEETESLSEEQIENTSEPFVLTAENMELIPEYEEEHFAVIEDVKADLIVDLGYNNSDIQQANAILPKADWFSSQLTDNQKKIYNASKAMGKGTNKFKFTATSKLVYEDFCQAISAYILTEPYKCDWMDLSSTGKLSIKAYYYSKSDPTYDFEVNIGKSKYYNASLNKEADAKVLELAAKAQEYALKNYPNAPVYGIVKYFDNWICENNYYHQTGVDGGDSKDGKVQEIYYYCHSSYGILLKGYGVCESYALAMTRLLDAIGIPNMYALGQVPSGGHAWNYVQMPNGKWYLQDTTFNDDEKSGHSTEEYLLCGDDIYHLPIGNRYADFTDIFEFVKCSTTDYKPESEQIVLSQTEQNLLPKKTATLTYQDSTYLSNENVAKVWSSSNLKVAKVDKNGKVTAVGAGSAQITLTAGGMTATCTVNVHQIQSLTFENGGKSNLTTSGGMEDGKGEVQHILLTVNQKAANPIYTAEELAARKVFDDFKVTSSNEKVATVTKEIRENTIDLAVTPVGMGKTTITVLFGTKKATLNFTVSEKISKSWFELVGYEQEVDYTGKAYKPKVVLTDEGKAKKAKYKVVYKNNKDAGTASVVITGTGNCGGELAYDFTIKPLALNVDESAVKATSKVYNGGVNPAKITVKHINGKKKVGLKAGKDYDIEYEYVNAETGKKETTKEPTAVGTYTIKITGKGNYTGSTVIESKSYTITPIDIKKLKVTVKVNGTTPTVTVAIGKNVLSKTDYQMAFFEDKNCTKAVDVKKLASKKQYFVQVKSAGSNVTTGAKSKPIVKSFKTK